MTGVGKGSKVQYIIVCGTGVKGGRQNEPQTDQKRDHLHGNGGEKRHKRETQRVVS
jgi:hypothetical protein